MDKISVGKFISEQRKNLSLTQKQLADMLDVTDKAVSRWETGKGYPDIETVERIAEILGVTINDVLSGKIVEPEEKEKATEKIIISSFGETAKTKKKWLRITTAIILSFSLIICTAIPILYFAFVSDLREGNYIVYAEKYYKYIDGDNLPDSFVLNAREKGYDGKILGRDGIDIIRKSSNSVLYNSEILGNNEIYALFDEKDIPSVSGALDLTVSLRSMGDKPFKLGDTKKVVNYLDSVKLTTPVNYYDIRINEFENNTIVMDCKEYDGYYMIGDILIGNNKTYFRPIEDMNNCYEISLDLLKK